MDANANPGADTITFNISGNGVQTFTPTNALPDLTGPLNINGYSEPGSSANTLASDDNSMHLIRLDGFKITSGSPGGLNFSNAATSGSSVRGLVIVRFANGIKANEASNLTITGSTNRVGGLNPGQQNVIQFNGGAGVEITSTTALQNEISGNRIYDNGGLGIDLGPSGVTTNDLATRTPARTVCKISRCSPTQASRSAH